MSGEGHKREGEREEEVRRTYRGERHVSSLANTCSKKRYDRRARARTNNRAPGVVSTRAHDAFFIDLPLLDVTPTPPSPHVTRPCFYRASRKLSTRGAQPRPLRRLEVCATSLSIKE